MARPTYDDVFEGMTEAELAVAFAPVSARDAALQTSTNYQLWGE